jgi:hypothetical protein
MALRTIPGTDLQYRLVSFDEAGRERQSSTGALDSEAMVAQLRDASGPVTDVFFMAHGWKGDVPAAIEQFDNWLGAMLGDVGGRALADARVGGFRPLIVGLHWPSQPWGEERLHVAGSRSHLLGDNHNAVDFFAELIADTDAARDALALVLGAPTRYGDCQDLPSEVSDAYDTLFRDSGLTEDCDLADLSNDQPSPWDADAIFRAALEVEAETPTRNLGGGLSDLLLSPLRQLSFWKMKNRARTVGESGAAGLLALLIGVAEPAVRFHLMGHSFGCIVVSAAVQAASAKPGWRSVDSLFLVQGALSLWAFARDVPGEDSSGYFHSILRDALVSGPMVATTSQYDSAVRRYYPIAARLASQATLSFADPPKYGGIGTFGVRGVEASTFILKPGALTELYGLAGRKVYNFEASQIIAYGDGASGAHNDISHPELAHLAWELVAAAK